ncbi:transposase [Corynebacterium sp. ACRPE]|uniref:RNA-guided endonuclease InsQ/TnpB family protein n=1 Tax=Corynebacterium sp. ACRPE TaxID=2918196 RepID=UPI001EF61CE4|nr:transposase [Corynebacterium sp. ACRPE]MCG7467244.1 transposase [Corynebacterium sp. ACRPE]
MSQVVQITRVSIKGATPYLGDKQGDSSQPIFSSSPNQVMEWLCSAWRTRFNDHRSQRKKYGKDKVLIPLGESIVNMTDKQAREERSFLKAVPSLVLQSPEQIEAKECLSSAKRRKTLKESGRNPGKMPKFKSYKKHDHTFVCWFNGGRNARFDKVGRKTGIVSITGMNPKGKRRSGDKGQRFIIRIHVRLSQEIRPYTSVQVNWTKKKLVFINEPLAVASRAQRGQGSAIGIDRGIVHMTADSQGYFEDLPWDTITSLDNKVRRLQRSQERSAKDLGFGSSHAAKKSGKHSKSSIRRDKEIAKTKAKISRVVQDAQHKVSRSLIEDHDIIAIEKLNLAGMSKKAKAKVDPHNPGEFLPNGQSAKKSLNRKLRLSALSQFGEFLQYKARLSGGQIIEVDPKNTSRRCSSCGHVAQENRESQTVFLCKKCGHSDNADHNAAINILDRALRDHDEEITDFWGGKHPSVRAYQSDPRGLTAGQRSPSIRKPICPST